MIKSITIKNTATFNEAGIVISDLNKVNLIYGANGSGKSTICKVLDDVKGYPDSSVEWSDGTETDLLIYDKAFREKNFLEEMPGVFTLGEASVAAKAEIEQKHTELNAIKDERKKYESDSNKQRVSIETEKSNITNNAWTSLVKKYEEWFPKSAIGANSKGVFIQKLTDAYNAGFEGVMTLEELKSKAHNLFGNIPTKMEMIKYEFYDSYKYVETDSIWSKVVIGKTDIDIAELITKFNNSDWVSKGIDYLEDGSDVCPFCQQHTIDSNFRAKLNDYFDESYKQDISSINEKFNAYQDGINLIIKTVESIVSTQKNIEKSCLEFESIDQLLNLFRATTARNIELINAKLKEPSRKIELSDTSGYLQSIIDSLKATNERISQNNYLVEHYYSERNDLVKQIFKFYAREYQAEIQSHLKKVDDCNKAVLTLATRISKADTIISQIDTDISNLEKSISSVKPTIAEINRILRGYGFTNFKIAEVQGKQNFYQIVRENSEPAKETLSEGETTFITFLYFMQLVKGSFNHSDVTRDRILIVDDPVSSLDSNVLYIVSTLLRDVFTDIHNNNGSVKQAIILTHNVFFHKEIAYYDKHCNWKHNIHYWILRKRNNVSSIQPYKKENPIKSSYELLWSELKNSSQHSCVVVQNIMRRIIENYFFVFGGYSPDTILKNFDNDEEQVICRSLLSWVNDGSHTLADDLYVEMMDDQFERHKDVFHKIFERTNQGAHYDMMMKSDSTPMP